MWALINGNISQCEIGEYYYIHLLSAGKREVKAACIESPHYIQAWKCPPLRFYISWCLPVWALFLWFVDSETTDVSEIICAVFYGRPKGFAEAKWGLTNLFLMSKKKRCFFCFFFSTNCFLLLFLSCLRVLFVSLTCLLIISALLCLPPFNLTLQISVQMSVVIASE